MGLGKTIQCIAVIAHMIEMGVKGPFLVAAPLSTVPNWVAEFKKFTPTVSAYFMCTVVRIKAHCLYYMYVCIYFELGSLICRI